MRMIERLQETEWAGGTAAVTGAVLQVLVRDTFFWLFWVLIAANLADWIAGRFRARNAHPCRFSRRISRQGLYEKAIALVIVLLIRSLEAIISSVMGISTMGIAASAITAALIYEDIESLDKHRMGMGKAPVPLLSATLEKLRDLTGADRRAGQRESDETP